MKSRREQFMRALLLSGAVALTVPQAATAAGTPACTQINNRAFVDYQVGGVPQTQIGSTDGSGNNNTSFYVGVKVDVIVTNDTSLSTTTPGATNATLNFTVLNNGNSPMAYDLTAADTIGVPNPYPPGTPNDSFNPSSINTTNGTPGSTHTIASLAAGASVGVPVVVTIPLGAANGALTVLSLNAQSKLVGNGTVINTKNPVGPFTGANIGGATCTAAGPATATIDVVAGDGAGVVDAANDGASSAYDGLTVSAAGLTITKTQAVYWDPVNLYVSPKAIPGAVVTYTVQVANAAGGANATNVAVGDDLNTMITATNIAFGNGIPVLVEPLQPNTSFRDATTNCTGSGAGFGVVVNGVCKSDVFLGNDGGSFGDATDPACGAANKVCASGITVNAGSTATVKYQVTIQ